MPDRTRLTSALGPGPPRRGLVIGVGNDLRRDDAVGRVVAQALAGDPALDVDVRVTHQLVPELADVVRRCRRLVLVDAVPAPSPDGAGTAPRARRLAPAGGGHGAGSGHVGDGARLLALAELCGGPVPPSWLVTVPASDLGFGVGLSTATAALVRPAVDLVLELVTGPDAASRAQP